MLMKYSPLSASLFWFIPEYGWRDNIHGDKSVIKPSNVIQQATNVLKPEEMLKSFLQGDHFFFFRACLLTAPPGGQQLHSLFCRCWLNGQSSRSATIVLSADTEYSMKMKQQQDVHLEQPLKSREPFLPWLHSGSSLGYALRLKAFLSDLCFLLNLFV